MESQYVDQRLSSIQKRLDQWKENQPMGWESPETRFIRDPASSSAFFTEKNERELLNELEFCYEIIQKAQKNESIYTTERVTALKDELNELRSSNTKYQSEVLELKNQKLNWLQSVEELKRQVFKREIDYETLLREKQRIELALTKRMSPLKPAEVAEKKPKKSIRRHSVNSESGHVTLATANRLIREIVQELKVSTPMQILPKIQRLKKKARLGPREFIETSREASVEYYNTPKNAIFSDISRTTEAKHSQRHRFVYEKAIVEKVKTLLGILPSADLSEVEAELNRRLHLTKY